MATSAWVEMENLSRDIADANGRIEAAKSVGSNAVSQVLHKEIAQLEARRVKLLTNIATSVVDGDAEVLHTEPTADLAEGTKERLIPAEPEANTAAAAQNMSDIVGERGAASMEPTQPNLAPQHGGDPAKEVVMPFQDPKSGRSSPHNAAVSWAQITPADLDRAKEDLKNRWVETLARHADELKGLAADQSDIDNVERAIEVFTRKFSSGGELVPLAAQSG